MTSINKVLLALFTFVVFSLSAASIAKADPVIFNNGAPNSSSGNEMTQWIQAEDFTFASAQTVTGVNFWGIDLLQGAYTGTITWQFYTNSGGSPGTLIASGNVAATRVFDHNTGFGQSFFYSFGVGSITFAPGTYWLGLHNGPLSTTNRLEMYWETTNPNGTQPGREDIAPFGDGFVSNGQEHAFQLTGNAPDAVPEPATMLLLGTGLAGIAAKVRRRKAK